MKPFLPLFPFIQSTYLHENYDEHVHNICACGSEFLCQYHCKSCYVRPPSCSKCIKTAHRHLPFHRIEKWNGNYFEKTSLWNLGLVFSLGHASEPCPNQLETAFCKIIVVDVNRYHNVDFQFCFCRDRELDEAKQLFSHQLFPATVLWPETVFMTEVLESFDIHHSTSTKSADSFCATLRKVSVAELPDDVSVSTTLFTRGSAYRFLLAGFLPYVYASITYSLTLASCLTEWTST